MKNKNNSINNIHNYEYYQIDENSGCISTQYNLKYTKGKNLFIVNNANEISGNYIIK